MTNPMRLASRWRASGQRRRIELGMTSMIRPAAPSDAESVCRIYNHYVANTVVTFEEEPVSSTDMRRRIDAVMAKSLPWLVAEDGGVVVGYGYLGPWAARSAYRFTLETTVYLDPLQVGVGHGGRLLERLVELLPSVGAHSAVGVIALPNPASVVLHERLGFSHVGTFSQVGFKFGQWIDVGMWQLRL